MLKCNYTGGSSSLRHSRRSSRLLLLAKDFTAAGGSLLLAISPITGSVANIIVVETAQPQFDIGFRQYFRAGLPVTAGTASDRLGVGSAYFPEWEP